MSTRSKKDNTACFPSTSTNDPKGKKRKAPDPPSETPSTKSTRQTKPKRPSTSTSTSPPPKRQPSPPPKRQPSPQPYITLPPTSPTTAPPLTTTHLTLPPKKGSLFASPPPHTLLLHACNTSGAWGAGIALSFKKLYPAAYTTYRTYCKAGKASTGTALLIPPAEEDGCWVGCLFTSRGYGKRKDGVEEILRATVGAVGMALEGVRGLEDEGEGEGKEKGRNISAIRMCKINSGKFGVPWERTEEVLQGMVLREGWRGEIEVWEP